jgi:hypothetical protein
VKEVEEQQVCCDENTPCVTDNNNNNSNKKMIIDTINCNNANVLHKVENPHSKNTNKQFNELELNNEHLEPDLNSKITVELEKSHREQLILLKDNKQNIIDFHHLQ